MSGELCESSATQDSALTIDMTNSDNSTQCASFSNIKVKGHMSSIQSIDNSQILNSGSSTHIWCIKSNQNTKIANGKKGSTSSAQLRSAQISSALIEYLIKLSSDSYKLKKLQ